MNKLPCVAIRDGWTKAKATPNVTMSLARRGRLTAVEVEAGAAIERGHASLGRCMFPAAQLDASLRGTGSKTSAPVNWLDRLSERELRTWKKNYMPWASAMKRVSTAEIFPRRKTSKVSWIYHNVLAVVTAIVQDNLTLKQCESRFRMEERTALGVLRFGLRQYAKGAGIG